MARKSDGPAKASRPLVALALQGGGSHGAFTWGVLDRLLEEPGLAIETITGTSAGAMNGVVLATGLLRGGPEGARKALRDFWEAIGRMPGLGATLAPVPEGSDRGWHLDNSPAYILMDFVSRMFTPRDLNPLNLHPLRDLVAAQVDFDAIRRADGLRVMVCATNVRTGRRHVFRNKEMSVEAVIASACLPYLFPASEIDGELYWDGGYTGNPAIAPLLRGTKAADLILVAINPLNRLEEPRSARDIINRVTEIAFNSTFMLELAAIAFVQRLCIDHGIKDRRVTDMHFHGIANETRIGQLGASSKLNNHPAFLDHLFGIGRDTAEAWLKQHGAALGKRSTIDISKLLPEDMREAVPV